MPANPVAEEAQERIAAQEAKRQLNEATLEEVAGSPPAPSVQLGDTVLYRPTEFDVHLVRNNGGHATGSSVFAALVTFVYPEPTFSAPRIVDLIFFGPGSQKGHPRQQVVEGHDEVDDAGTFIQR